MGDPGVRGRAAAGLGTMGSLEDYLAVTEEEATRKFKSKSLAKKKRKRKKLTLKKILDASSFDKQARGSANCEFQPTSFSPRSRDRRISIHRDPRSCPVLCSRSSRRAQGATSRWGRR